MKSLQSAGTPMGPVRLPSCTRTAESRLNGRWPWLLLGLLAVACAGPARAWQTELQDGARVTVDPATHRATVLRNGVRTPLWDGVHRLKDGSILIIRSGEAVPNEAVVSATRRLPQAPAASWQGREIVGYSPCERLVRRVCGRHDECRGAEPCDLSNQLLSMEKAERAKSGAPNLMTASSGQCLQAERDLGYFRSCGQKAPATTASAPRPTPRPATSACQQLVWKVCGLHDQCGQSTACDMAHQLQQMAQQERTAGNGGATPVSENRCMASLSDPAYFPRCRQAP